MKTPSASYRIEYGFSTAGTAVDSGTQLCCLIVHVLFEINSFISTEKKNKISDSFMRFSRGSANDING